jgi:hypothetical protein
MKNKHMKTIYILLAASLMIASCGPTTVIQQDSYQPAPAPPPVADVSYQSFYDQLSPYGNWISYPGYGYVWMPNAGPDFRPYASNGNWIYTNAGWTWASNYNWGWAPFHYGRWFYENGYGWMWVPGNEWAPAWVSWRTGGDYYGWAPLGPRISVDVALSNYNPPVNYWNFVPRRYMGNPGWHNYYVNENRNVTIINNTTIINNYSGTNRAQYAYAPGPDPNEVRRYSGNNFTPVQIRESNSPGERVSGNQYVLYHPRVSSSPVNRGNEGNRPATPAPARYESFNNVRPSNQNPSYNQPANNQTVNNPRPANPAPGYNQPANNPRPAAPNPGYNQPGNSQPANPRPAMQNPGTNQPVNNEPATNPRPATPNPGYNQPANNQPAQNPRPAAQTPNANQPVQPNPNSGNHMQDVRTREINQASSNTRPAQSAQPQHPAPANQTQTTGRPSTVHNPGNGQPVQRTAKPENKPEQKPAEQPKTRKAEDNQ